MRKLVFVILSVSVLLAYAPVFAARQDSMLAHVLETRVLRCGYVPYAPFVTKDPNSGTLGGLVFDYINDAAERRGLDVRWVETSGFDQIAPALAAGKIDAFCLPATPDAAWEGVFDFSADLGGVPYFVWVRTDRDLSRKDLRDARFAVIDGLAATAVTQHFFPQAQQASLPQSHSPADLFNLLRFGKADAVVSDAVSALAYIRSNPGAIRRDSPAPLVVLKMYLLSRKGDGRMRDFLDDLFSVEGVQAIARLDRARRRAGVPEGVLAYGKACPKTVVTKERWYTCP